MRRFLVPVALLLAVASVAVSAESRPAVTVDLRERLTLDVAATDAARTLGLSGRASLPSDRGMLFMFGSPGYYSFWMKDMRFPLDIVWLRGDRVVDLVTLPATSTAGIPSHTPLVRADRVLELGAGSADRFGFRRGDRLLLPFAH